ncbi:MAG TPA: methyltransferase [Victivallales bacterium]|nr:methyltransferase [Victivallales bacterium]
MKKNDTIFNTVANIALGKITEGILEIVQGEKLLEKLDNQNLPLQEVSELWQLPLMTTRTIAQCLSGIGILRYKDEKLSLSEEADYFLEYFNLIHNAVIGSPYIESSDLVKKRILDPQPLNWYVMRNQGKKPEETDLGPDFFTSLHKQRIHWGTELAAQYDFSKHNTLMDIGGASGGWCLGVQKRNPHLNCIIFDMAPVCKIAEQFIEKAGVKEHIKTVGGNFFVDDLPNTADVIMLANVLHDWNIDDCHKILRKVFNALKPGGSILVKEFYAENDWSGSVWAGYHSLTVLGQGEETGWQPSYEEMGVIMKTEGFSQIEDRKDLVIGKKL